MEVQNALRDKVVSSICAMDVRMLDAILPENGRYEDTYKEVWMAKLVSFYKSCKMNGDISLTVRRRQCEEENWHAFGQMVWIFEAEQTKKHFAIYFEMDGDSINGIQRCYGHYDDDDDDDDDVEMPYFEVDIDFEAFHVYDHEKIGFIDTYELKELRHNVKLFMADLCNPMRHTVDVIGVKRMVEKYNQLYLDLLECTHLFENKMEMLRIYEDFWGLKNIFTQKKGFEQVVTKCHDLVQCTDNNAKIKVMKWFLRNQKKVTDYFISYNYFEVEENRMLYFYRINDKEHRLVISHPNYRMDVETCYVLQSYIMPFYDYLLCELIKAKTSKLRVGSRGIIYDYFKDKLADVIEPYDEWIGVWF